MTSILPSPCWLITTVSPRFPTRLSTLILSCKNFSNADTSKILSEAGCEALMVNYLGGEERKYMNVVSKTVIANYQKTRKCNRRTTPKDRQMRESGKERKTKPTFLVILEVLPPLAAGRLGFYISQKEQNHP